MSSIRVNSRIDILKEFLIVNLCVATKIWLLSHHFAWGGDRLEEEEFLHLPELHRLLACSLPLTHVHLVPPHSEESLSMSKLWVKRQTTANSLLKDIYFPFLSLHWFAAKL